MVTVNVFRKCFGARQVIAYRDQEHTSTGLWQSEVGGVKEMLTYDVAQRTRTCPLNAVIMVSPQLPVFRYYSWLFELTLDVCEVRGERRTRQARNVLENHKLGLEFSNRIERCWKHVAIVFVTCVNACE